MTRYIPGQVYTFIGVGGRLGTAQTKEQAKGRVHERRMVYVGRAASAAIGGLEIFRSATAAWKESFTREQLGDFRSIVAEGDKKKAAAGTAA